MTEIIELAEIRLAPGRTEAELVAASDQFQERFLRHQPGFVQRDLLRGDGGWADLVVWRDQASADAIMAAAMSSPDCAAYFGLMQMDGDMTSAVRHYRRLARYQG